MPIDRTSAEREVVNGEPQIVQEDGVLGWLTRGRPATVASTAMLCVASTALVAIAVTAPGYTATSIDLNDAGVWVTGTRQALLGQINTDTRQSAMAIPDLTANSFDVLQDGALVVETDSDASTIRKVDIPMRRFVTEPVKVPKVTLVAVGGGVLAAADPTTGKVWVQGPQDAGVQPVSTADPVVKVGKVAALAVGPDATIHLITADPARLTSIPAPAAQPGSPQVTDLHAIADRLRGASLSLTAVGERPVGLVTNRAGAAVLLPGGSLVDLPDGESARLQQPGDAADAVLVATASALYSVALDGGKVQRVSGGAAGRGAPAAPVWLGGCSYAAWSAYPPTLVTACQGQAARQTRIGAAPSQAPTLAFRVNRQRILLNDATTGETFMLDDSTHNVAVWDHMQKPAATHVENLRAKAVRRPTAADRNKPNHKPVVKPDIFGVRPGRTVVLPVLANDTDPDGDVLLASLAPGQSGNVARGAFDVVDGGKELQFHAGPRPGTVHVVYVADDGRANGQASATVTVRIVDPGEPHKPVPLDQAPEVAVRQGGTVSYDVLADWIDSEGDPLTLTCPKESDVRCRPDGVLTYRDGGGPVGSRSIPVQVGDGTGEPTEGILRIRVVAPDEEAPLARPDDARTFVGTPVVIRPLDNDTAFGLDPLRLGKVTSTDPAASVKVAGDSSVSFSTPSPGSVYLTYQVSAGPKTSEGLVRVDITQPTGEHAPVAAPDSVLVRPLEPAAVDVLANDSDPDGDVLVVTGAQLGTTLSASTAPRTEVIGHRLLRVTAPAGFTGTTTLTYTVSDGTSEAQGEVLVRSAPPEETDQPPIAADDEAVVRAGQIVTVPVLANDTDPEGLPLHLDPTIGDATFRQAGDSTVNKVNIFASGTTVRLFAPDKPGTVTATYTARDAAGQPDSAAVTGPRDRRRRAQQPATAAAARGAHRRGASRRHHRAPVRHRPRR